MNQLPSPHLPAAGKYLTFALQNEQYSVPVLKVREIMRLCPITPVPRMPSFVQGVINLRGKIVPVINLRERLGLSQAHDRDRACVIVVQSDSAEGPAQLIGMVVDSVEEVSHFHPPDLELPPDFGSHIDNRFITGMAKSKDTVKTLLDLDRLLNLEGPLAVPTLDARPSV